MKYKGITFCDACGRRLEEGQWLVGLCKGCEATAKAPRRPVEVVKPRKGL